MTFTLTLGSHLFHPTGQDNHFPILPSSSSSDPGASRSIFKPATRWHCTTHLSPHGHYSVSVCWAGWGEGSDRALVQVLCFI